MDVKSVFRKFGMFALLGALFLGEAQSQELPRLSPNASVYQQIGLTDVTITYSRPGVKGRVIWGGLVPYGKVWRTGANEATKITFSDDVKINGNPLPAGTYSLFTIPTPDTWTIIFNKNTKLWGAFAYKQAEDALRIQVKPLQANAAMERMMFYFDNLTDNSADVVLYWEKLKVPFTVKVDVKGKALANIEKAMADFKGDDWRVPFRSASYLYNSDLELSRALTYVERSIQVQKNYFNTGLKAKLLAKMGKTKQALQVAREALSLAEQMEQAPGDLRAFKQLVSEWGK